MKNLARTLAVATLLIGLVAVAHAEPATIAIQGKLKQANGNALTGTRLWRVRFYDAAVDGHQIGSDQTGTLTLSAAGRFSISLTPPQNLLDSAAAFYELAVDSAASPDGSIDAQDVFPDRVQMHSVPWARNAGQLGGTPASDFARASQVPDSATLWKLDGNPLASLTNPFLGSTDDTPLVLRAGAGVGINKSDPTSGSLDINGDLRFSGDIYGKAVRSVNPEGDRVIHGYIRYGFPDGANGFDSLLTSADVYRVIFDQPFNERPAISVTPANSQQVIATLTMLATDEVDLKFYTLSGAVATPNLFSFTAIGK